MFFDNPTEKIFIKNLWIEIVNEKWYIVQIRGALQDGTIGFIEFLWSLMSKLTL